MKEQEVYVKADEATNLALIEYSDDVWSRTSSYLKPTTGILLTKEELVKLLNEAMTYLLARPEKTVADSKKHFLESKGLL